MKKILNIIIILSLILIMTACETIVYNGRGIVETISTGLVTSTETYSTVNYSVIIKTEDGYFIGSSEDRKWGSHKQGDEIEFTYEKYKDSYVNKIGNYNTRTTKLINRK